MLIGCGPGIDTKPNQDMVAKIIWVQAYRMTVRPPFIEWIEQNDLTCANAQGFENEYLANNKIAYGCVAGLSYVDLWTTKIAWPAGSRFSDTAMAHEFAHFYEYMTTGDSDADHLSDCFVPITGCVDKVNAVLMDSGL